MITGDDVLEAFRRLHASDAADRYSCASLDDTDMMLDGTFDANAIADALNVIMDEKAGNKPV